MNGCDCGIIFSKSALTFRRVARQPSTTVISAQKRTTQMRLLKISRSSRPPEFRSKSFRSAMVGRRSSRMSLAEIVTAAPTKGFSGCARLKRLYESASCAHDGHATGPERGDAGKQEGAA